MVGGTLCKCYPCRHGRGEVQEEEIKITEKANHDNCDKNEENEDNKEDEDGLEVETTGPPLLISLQQTHLHDIEEIEEEQNGCDDTSSSSTLFSKNSSSRKEHRGSGGSRQFQSSPSPTFSISNIHLIKGRRKKKIRCVQGGVKIFLMEGFLFFFLMLSEAAV